LLGLSNFNSKQVDDIISKAQIKPAVLQVECHPYLNQAQLIKHCKERDIVGKYSTLEYSSCQHCSIFFRQWALSLVTVWACDMDLLYNENSTADRQQL